ncbi:Hypothetical predicted protein [Cloeon dipterum]|uniref:Ufm1-specific protease 2 n=1 Tax=Cloeon dipterum TaxID=197152 RepID=A0A8S1CBD5_9INSE|nr:Hypothetical predicted protein [Cloeon dipterum]
MAPKPRRLILSNLVFEKFSNTAQGFGLAYGLINDEQCYVLGFLLADESSTVAQLLSSDSGSLSLTSELLKCWAAYEKTLPAGVHIVGNICVPGADDSLVSVVEAAIPDIIEEGVYHCPEGGSPLTLVFKDGVIKASMVDDFMQKEELEYEIVPLSDVLDNFMLVHLKGQIPISSELSDKALNEEMTEQISRASMGVHSFRFKPDVFLNSPDEVNGGDGGRKAASLVVQDGEGKKKKARPGSEMEVVSAELLTKPTKFIEANEIHNFAKCAPFVQHKKGNFEMVKIGFNVDGLCYVHKEKPVIKMYSVLQSCLTRQLFLAKSCLLKELSQKCDISLPISMHFLSPQNGHYLTMAFPEQSDDSALEEDRKTLHDVFVLSKDRPVFRIGCRVTIKDDQPKNAQLINPHVGLSPGIKDAEVAVVYGRYAYHHYMQDSFDDNGWGCAYRSLQTLVSWFRLQGYTDKPVPSHKAIQQCLVDIGDKPHSFVGSKQWIGSTEVSFCMESLLGVTCRIMAVNSADELCSRADDLLRHFRNQGTPVMIGELKVFKSVVENVAVFVI